MIKRMVKAAIGQICSTADYSHNLKQCSILVEKAAKAGARALFLPEAADYLASSAKESLSLAQPIKKSSFVLGLQDAARKSNLAISVGIHEPVENGAGAPTERLRNLLIWIDAMGEITQIYQKLHLFDVDIEGGPKIKESDTVERGPRIEKPFETELGEIGHQICFDLRFPEPPLALKRQGANIICYPSAFAMITGKAHWEPLLRARAIETQCYVIASAQVGKHNEKRESYGHSLVVDPWGRVLVDLGGEWKGEPEMATFDIDKELVERVRREVPLLRRTDVYPEI